MKMQSIWRRLLNYFLQGLLFTAPLAITIYILYLGFRYIDGLLEKYIEVIIGFKIPGLGLAIILVLVTLIGMAGSSFLFRPFISMLDKFISKAPVINLIYTSLKDFLNALVGKEKRFNRPVLVEMYPGSGVSKMGFITKEDMTQLGLPQGKVAVYLPHSYNFSGNLFIVPAERVTPLNMPPAEAMKFVVSAGITK